MTQCDNFERHLIPDSDTPLLLDLAEANRLARELNRLEPSQRLALQALLRPVLERLWENLQHDFLVEARRHQRKAGSSNSNDAVLSIALNLFSALIRKLPLRDAPDGNIRGWLIGVARNKSIDDHWQDLGLRRRKKPKAEPSSTVGSADANMAPSVRHVGQQLGVYDDESHEILEPVDNDTLDWENQLVERAFKQIATEHVWKRLLPELTPQKRFVLWCRIREEPLPFEEIAELLGAGYTESAVRQIWHRICIKARAIYEEVDPK